MSNRHFAWSTAAIFLIAAGAFAWAFRLAGDDPSDASRWWSLYLCGAILLASPLLSFFIARRIVRDPTSATAREEVVRELKYLPDYNRVLQAQLAAVIEGTEKAAVDLSSQFQAADVVVASLDRLAASRKSAIDQRRAETARRLAELTERMRRVAASLETRFDGKPEIADIETERAALRDVVSRLDELGCGLQESAASEIEIVDAVGASANRLADLLTNALASLQFQDATRQQVELAIDALDHLDRHSDQLAARLSRFDAPDHKLTPLSAHLDQIRSKYVMDSQRDAHRAATGQTVPGNTGGSGSEPKVELF